MKSQLGNYWNSLTFSLVGITLLGLVLRIPLIVDRSFWLDEAFSWSMATQNSITEIVNRSANDFNPPLYYFLLKAWILIFGDSEISQRLLSVAFGTMTIPSVYLLCRDGFSANKESHNHTDSASAQEVGLIAATFVAVSTSHIVWSAETRMYTMLTFLTVFSTWSLLRLLQNSASSIQWNVLYGVLAITVFYTHTYGVFTLVSQGFFVFGWHLYRYGRTNRTQKKTQAGQSQHRLREQPIIHFVILYSTIAVFCFPWIVTLMRQTRAASNEYWIPPLNVWTIPQIWTQLIQPQNAMHTDVNHGYALAVFSVVIFLLGAFLCSSMNSGKLLILTVFLTPIICALIISKFVVSILVPRHLLASFLLFLCMAASSMCLIPIRPIRRMLAGLAIFNLMYFNCLYFDDLQISTRPGMRAAIQQLNRNHQPGDRVVVSHPAVLLSARYYMRCRQSNALLMDNSGIAKFWGATLIDENDQIRDDRFFHEKSNRIWEIGSTGFRSPKFNVTTPIPVDLWKKDSTQSFPAVLWFEKDVTLSLYTRTANSGQEH